MTTDEKHLMTKINMFEDMMFRSKNDYEIEQIRVELKKKCVKNYKNYNGRELSGSFLFREIHTLYYEIINFNKHYILGGIVMMTCAQRMARIRFMEKMEKSNRTKTENGTMKYYDKNGDVMIEAKMIRKDED